MRNVYLESHVALYISKWWRCLLCSTCCYQVVRLVNLKLLTICLVFFMCRYRFKMYKQMNGYVSFLVSLSIVVISGLLLSVLFTYCYRSCLEATSGSIHMLPVDIFSGFKELMMSTFQVIDLYFKHILYSNW